MRNKQLLLPLLVLAALGTAAAADIAPVAVAAPSPVLDVTSIVIAIVGSLFTMISAIAVALINSHVKDQTAASKIDAAVENALGVMQQTITGQLAAQPCKVQLPPGTSPALASAVQFALDQAGPELTRLGITPEMLARRIEAKLGVLNLHANLVAAATRPMVPAGLIPTPTITPPTLVASVKPVN